MSKCAVCSHRDMAVIEGRIHAGESYSQISRTFGMSRFSVGRHANDHMVVGSVLPVLGLVEQDGQLDDLDGRLVRLEAVLTTAMEQAAKSGKTSQLFSASREIRSTVDSLAKLRGLLAEQRPVIVNVLQLPEVRDMATRLQVALAPWPEARLAAARALSAGEDGDGDR